MSLFVNTSIDLLSRALDASQLRQQVISHNIANVDTPYYQSARVTFEDVLQQELANGNAFQGLKTDPRHVTIGLPGRNDLKPEVHQTSGSRMNNNDNNVDIDAEMALMARNGLWYQGLTQSLNHELRQLRQVITEGRG